MVLELTLSKKNKKILLNGDSPYYIDIISKSGYKPEYAYIQPKTILPTFNCMFSLHF